MNPKEGVGMGLQDNIKKVRGKGKIKRYVVKMKFLLEESISRKVSKKYYIVDIKTDEVLCTCAFGEYAFKIRRLLNKEAQKDAST